MFTDAAAFAAGPTISRITKKQALVSWSSDRTSDSKIQYCTSSGDYFDEEPSNSTQVTAHEITLTNLDPGTNYYAVSKWTDEDGNTGVSDEFTFETAPAPTAQDVSVKSAGLTSATIQFTSIGASIASANSCLLIHFTTGA